MNWFDRIKNFYSLNYWTIEMVANGVKAEKITPIQYNEITGLIYE